MTSDTTTAAVAESDALLRARAASRGIHVIDSGFVRPQFDAVHLIEHAGRCAIVDTCVNAAVPKVLAALDQRGLTTAQVDWVVLTHVHLDHAGGAGQLMAALPSARLLVHPRGARHMIEPAKLVAGTMAVYGREETLRMYGEIVPVPDDRVSEAIDGFVIALGGRRLRAIDTPGHAYHHLCLVDADANTVFTGDTFGLSYPQMTDGRRRYVMPVTTPVQFDPQALHASIDRIMSLAPDFVCLTHYGPIDDVARHGADLHRQVDLLTTMAQQCADSDDLPAALRAGVRSFVLDEAARQGWVGSEADWLSLMASDIELNADGLLAWLARRNSQSAA